MKVIQRVDRDGLRVDLIPRPRVILRIGLMALAVATVLLCWLLDTRGSGQGSSHWQLLVFAGLAAALALGQAVYSVYPRRGAQLRFFVFGIPLLKKTIPPEAIHSSEIISESSDSFSLRFLDSMGSPSLTIEHFPSAEAAEKIASFYRFDEHGREERIRFTIEAELAASREFSPAFQAVVVSLIFAVTPTLVLLLRLEPGEIGIHLGIGIAITIGAFVATRRSEGVLGHSTEDASIDYWACQGLFRKVDYRQFLGDPPQQQILRVRTNYWLLPVALTCIAQAGAIFAVAEHNRRSLAPYRTEQAPEATPQPDPELVRRGAEAARKLLELRAKRPEPPDSKERTPPETE